MAKKIMLIGNVSSAMRLFRSELLTSLVREYQVFLVAEFEQKDEEMFSRIGIRCINIPIDRRGMNVFRDILLSIKYLYYLIAIHPDLVMTFTIKPNTYAGILCRILKIKYIVTVEGLGTLFNSRKTLLNRVIRRCCGAGIYGAEVVFYLNDYIKIVLLKLGTRKNSLKYIPGMGVNLKKFTPIPYPEEHPFSLLTIGRIMKEKGFEELLAASDELSKSIPDLEWHICGIPEKGEEFWIEQLKRRPWIKYHGLVLDTKQMYAKCQAIVTTTYHEGLSTVCIEAAACGRPVLGTKIYGVQETIKDGETGFLIKPKDVNNTIDVILRFYHLPWMDRKIMGKAAFEKVSREFDRQRVVIIYNREIIKCLETKDNKDRAW